MRTAGITVVAIAARIAIWIVALFFGGWIASLTGWGAIMNSHALLWRIIGAVAAIVVLMFLTDRLWGRAAPARFFVREFSRRPRDAWRLLLRAFIDAFIIGFFFGVVFAV